MYRVLKLIKLLLVVMAAIVLLAPKVATAQYVCNGLTVAVDVTMIAGPTPNTITNCVIQGTVTVPSGAVLSVIGGRFENTASNQLVLQNMSMANIDSATFADTTSDTTYSIHVSGEVSVLVQRSIFVAAGCIFLDTVVITPTASFNIIGNDLRSMNRNFPLVRTFSTVTFIGGSVTVSNNDGTQEPLLAAIDRWSVVQFGQNVLAPAGPNAGCYITINGNVGTTDILHIQILIMDEGVPGKLEVFNNSVSSKDSLSSAPLLLFLMPTNSLASSDFIINITQNTFYHVWTLSPTVGSLEFAKLGPFISSWTITFKSPMYLINNTITHADATSHGTFMIVVMKQLICNGNCYITVSDNTVVSNGNLGATSLMELRNLEGGWNIKVHRNKLEVTTSAAMDIPTIRITTGGLHLVNGSLNVNGNHINVTTTDSTKTTPFILGDAMSFNSSELSITYNYITLTGGTVSPIVTLSGSATVFGVGSRLIFENNQFGPTITSVFPSTTFASHGDLRPKGCGNKQLDGTPFDVAATEPTYYWETCTRTNTPSMTLLPTPTMSRTSTHTSKLEEAPLPSPIIYEAPFSTPTVAAVGGVALGVGVAGVSESSSSLQMLVILTTMACRTKDTVSGGKDEGQSLLAPLFIPGLGGSKYVVGSFILLASITAVYVLIVHLIFAVIRWRTEDDVVAAERVWKARLFTFYPRLPVVGAVLLMPGVTFDSASLLYGDESGSVWWERLIGAVGVALCLVLTAYHVVVGFIAAPHNRVDKLTSQAYINNATSDEAVHTTNNDVPMETVEYQFDMQNTEHIDNSESDPKRDHSVTDLKYDHIVGSSTTANMTTPPPSDIVANDDDDDSLCEPPDDYPITQQQYITSDSHPHTPADGIQLHPRTPSNDPQPPDNNSSCSSARSPMADVDGHNNDGTADDTTPHSAQADKDSPACVDHDPTENTGTQPQQQHQSTATLEKWFVEYPPAMRDAVPQPLRAALIPLTKWDAVVGRTIYCILTTYRPDVAARVLSHNVFRILFISVVAAINPGTEGGCNTVQGFLAAICFVHGLFVFTTRAYRVPALTALQGLQSLLLGLVSCVPFMGGDNTRITAGMAYSMIAVVLLEGVVSVLVGLVEFILQRKFRTVGQQVEDYPQIG